MEIVLTYACYFFEIIILNYIDYRRFKTIINPFFFLSVPFSIVLLCCIFFNKNLGFVQVYAISLWVWIVGLLLFWIAGLAIGKSRRNLTKSCFSWKTVDYRPFHWLLLVCIAITAIKFRHILANMGANMASKDFGSDLGTGGVLGRISNILLIAIPFYFGYKWPKCVRLCIVAALMIYVFSLGSKMWVTYSIVATMIVSSNSRKNNSYFKTIVITAISLIAAFILYYVVNIQTEDAEGLRTFITRHIYFYITSGLLPLSEYVRQDIPHIPMGVSLPFITIIRIWLGEPIPEVHSSLWITTDCETGLQSNVFTLFGQLFIEGGIRDYIVLSLLTGFISYYVFNLARASNSIFPKIASGYTMAALFFGWFNWGFFSLRIWEIYAFCLLFYYFFNYHFLKKTDYPHDYP